MGTGTAESTAIAALLGSLIGGLTSLGASWLSQYAHWRAQRRIADLSRRDELYRSFVEEASRAYIDAFEHSTANVSSLVNVYALISRMRMVSSPNIVESGESVARMIIATYLAPNRTLKDVPAALENDAVDPLRDFSNACRDELVERGAF